MGTIYLFALIWIALNSYTLYHVLFKRERDEERDELRRQLLEMCRIISPAGISKVMYALYIALLAFDLVGFYLTYTYAYSAENHFYLRIMLFIAFVLVFVVEQIMSLKQTIKIAGAIQAPNVKENVLKRFIRITDRDMDSVSSISSVAKFVAALQLVLYTILANGQ